MDFSLDKEHELFKKTVREFLQRELEPISKDIDSKKEIPREFIKKMAEFGLLGLTLSSEYGGIEADNISAVIAAEEIGRADISVATAVYYLLLASWSKILEKYGTEEAKQEFLPKITKGEWFMGIASTEPHGGSDVLNINTTMKVEHNNLIVNGEKIFISGVKEASLYGGGFVTIVKHDPSKGHRGIAAVLTTIKDNEHVETGIIENMGRGGISTGYIKYNDTPYPQEYLIGDMERGFYYAMEGFNLARPLVAAACIGAAEKALDIGLDFIKNRIMFGRPLAKYEAIQFEAVEDYIKLEMAKDLVYKTAWMLDEYYRNKRFALSDINKMVAASKWIATETAYNILTHVMMWHGALGYSKELPIERGLRGILSYLVGAEGAINIMKLIIGRELFGRDFMPTKP
jgi:acyl-CoA dehydrogenase